MRHPTPADGLPSRRGEWLCPWCGKAYVYLGVLQRHIESVHCGRYPGPSLFDRGGALGTSAISARNAPEPKQG